MKSIKGFTLIELVITIAIVGILAIAVSTIIINYKSGNVPVAAKTIRNDIELARGQAMMKRGTTFGAYFDVSNNQYTVYQDTLATPILNPQTRQPLIRNVSDWAGVTLDGSDFTVEFNQFGSPTTGGGGSIQVTDGTTTKTISVLAGTGKVNVN